MGLILDDLDDPALGRVIDPIQTLDLLGQLLAQRGRNDRRPDPPRHRRQFRDPAWMPPGKVLEMTTLDSARALGLDADLGSLEAGKKADIVLVVLRKPHLYPPNLPVTRIAHFANAGDVDSVIVDGRVLLRGRQPLAVEENEILDRAPAEFWGTNRRGEAGYPVRGPVDGLLHDL